MALRMWYAHRARWWLRNQWYRFKATVKRWWKNLGAGAALYKVLGGAKLLGFVKFGKMGGMLVSMFIFAWIMALQNGWAFGVGFVLLLFVHEMGHALAAAMLGMDVSAPVFIPLLGAVINLRRAPKNAVQEAFIGAGGPVTGTLGTLVCLALYLGTHRQLYMGLALIGAYVHLFNLLPVAPLDGGRMVAPLSRWIWYPVLPLLLFAGLYTGNFIMLLIVWFGLVEIRRTYGPLAKEYFKALWWQRVIAAAVYFGLLAVNAGVFRLVLGWEEAQGLGAPNPTEGMMNPWLAAGLTLLITAGYVAWQVWRGRRQREAHAQEMARLAAAPAVSPRVAWLRRLRVYRRLSARHGRRWRVRYRGTRSGYPAVQGAH